MSSGRISRRYLSEEERIRIADLRRETKSIRSIAAELGRSPSTVSREIRRNCNRNVSRATRPTTALLLPTGAPRRGGLDLSRGGSRHVLRSGTLSRRGWTRSGAPSRSRTSSAGSPNRPEMHVTHETIYRALYTQARGGLWREISRRLRTGRCVRKGRRHPDQRQPRFLHPMAMISQRPFEPADRSVPGHWEGDLIIGAKNGSAIGTLVERSTRYTLLVHLPKRSAPGSPRRRSWRPSRTFRRTSSTR
ncbi:IS30 family transposase [Streptomyces nigrescens]|uniref:IS30 family transposase n=1 Tax=Streptomyces nigrescens TaxID=1920 RepID=UPI001E529228|nr:IS30 family transposase [Streptomyces libani]